MKKFDRKQTLIFFYGFDVFLFLIVLLLLIPFSGKKSPDSRMYSFIERDMVNEISSFEILDLEEGICVEVSRVGRLWVGTDSNSEKTFRWPADGKKITSFLRLLSEERKVNKKTDNAALWHDFGVGSHEALCVKFFDFSGRTVSEIYVGNENSLERRVCFRDMSCSTVWDVDSSVFGILSSSPDFWCETGIFPSFLEEGDMNLTHGKLVYLKPSAEVVPMDVLTVNFANSSKAVFSVYEKDGACIVLPSFLAPDFYSDDEKKAVGMMNYRYSVSMQTYDKFKNYLRKLGDDCE